MADGISDFDYQSADIPIWGWLSGASARRDAAYARAEQQRAEQAWRDLAGTAPTAEDLTVTYGTEGTTDEYGDLIGGPSQFEGVGANEAQMRALAQMQQHAMGGYSAADYNSMRSARDMRAQHQGAQNQALAAQMQARGMGGSGAQLAAQLAGTQQLANANSAYDAQMGQSAQMRAMQALMGSADMGNTMASQDMQRRAALDAFNQGNTDWRRGRESRNTAWDNQSAESAANARQQAYGNQERAVAGATNQWQAGSSERQGNAQRRDQADQAAAAGIGTIITSALG